MPAGRGDTGGADMILPRALRSRRGDVNDLVTLSMFRSFGFGTCSRIHGLGAWSCRRAGVHFVGHALAFAYQWGASEGVEEGDMFDFRDLFQWERFITPSIIKIFYWLMLTMAVLGGLQLIFGGLGLMLISPVAGILTM